MNSDSKTIPLTQLDQQTYCGPSQMLKAAIPYMDPSSAKILAMLARIMEFQHTMSAFESKSISICSVNQHKPSLEEALKDIRKYCSETEAAQIDQALNIINAIHLYSQYAELSKNTDISNLMSQVNQMKNMSISPEQIQLLQTLFKSQS